MRDRALVGLFIVTSVAGLACTPESARVTPTATVAATTTAPMTAAPTPTRTTTPAPTSFAVVPTVSPDPAGPATAACPTQTGGSALAAPRVAALRAAHNPGFDRLVIELTEQVVPQYEIKASTSVIGSPSGMSLRVDGNAFFSVRVAGQAHTDAGRSYPQADPYRPALPLIREVKFVTDFEGVVIFGVGLERVACPAVLVLFSPPRIVLDFPTPP